MNTKQHTLRSFLAAMTLLLASFSTASAQNLIINGDFNAIATGWTTSCVTVEAYGTESSYGGTSTTNHVAEIDDEACMHQDVCALPGYSFVFSMDASRRTGGGPNPCISHIKITGLDVGGTVVATYVDMDYTRTNTVFALTPVTGIPGFTVASGSGVVKVRVELTDNTPGYLTLGMIVDNLSLTYVAGPTGGTPSTTCQGVPVSFDVAGAPAGLTYNWLFGTGATPATSTLSNPSASWNAPGSFTVKVALGNGTCNDTLTYPVTVTPSVTSSFAVTTCAQPYTFGGHTYNTSGTYTDTITAAGGCDSIVTLYLTVNPLPAPPSVSPAAFCQYDAATPLTATGSSLMWYGPGLGSGSATAPTVSTAVPDSITYYVTQTVAGCTSDSAVALAVVKPQPLPPHVIDTTYCQFQTAGPLIASGSNLLWYVVPVAGSPIPVPPVPSTVIVGSAHWYVTQTINGCTSPRAMQTVKTSKPPSFQITADHTHLCLKDTASLFYTGDAGISGYKWTLPGNFNVSGGTLTTANMVVIPTATGNQPVYLKVTDSTGRCSAIDTLVLTVAANPTAQITTTNGVCLGDSATLGLVSRSANADSFAWYIDNTPLHQSGFINISAHTSHSGGPFVISWTTSGMHVISVIAISQEGCKSQIAYDSVLVNTPPDATFSLVTTGPLCLEDSAYFQARETGYGYSYLWTPGQFFNNVNTPSAWGRLNSQQSTIKLTVTDAFGCTSSTSQEFNPQLCCKIEFPSAFTPNGDGRNEVFRPIVSGYHNFHKFSIVNRWGQVVFESANSNFQWDGNYNGVPQDMGVYYYVLRYDCGGNTLVQKGDVTLIR